MTVTTTIVVSTDAVPPAGLQDVVVRVFSEDGSTSVTQGVTDDGGELVLELEDATTYWVRFFKMGYSFESQTLIAVDSGASSNTFDVEAVDLTVLPPSTSPYLCKASGYVGGADLTPRAGVRMTFSMTGRPRILGGRVMVVQDVVAVSDADGWVEVELARGGVYDLVVDGLDDEVIRVAVPDRTSVSITDLAWPYVAVLEYDADAVSVASGESVEVGAVVTLSSGASTPVVLDAGTTLYAGQYVSFASSDASVATVEVRTEGIVVTGRSAGSAEISATPVPTMEARRSPEPARSIAVLSVTVT